MSDSDPAMHEHEGESTAETPQTGAGASVSASSTTRLDERPVLLSARGVRKTYTVGGSPLHVLRGVDLDVREGEILAILGKSGCGKSTMLHCLGWLERVDEKQGGEIIFQGQNRASLSNAQRARLRNRDVGFVFQFYHLLPELTAFENILMPAMIQFGRLAWGKHKAEARERARTLLELVGLTDRSGQKPRYLSGGERQRVAIARALINEPRFLFCDEPTGNLDGRTADAVRDVLWGLNKERGQTMVVVTHDARLARQADRIVHLHEGRIVEGRALDLVEEVGHED